MSSQSSTNNYSPTHKNTDPCSAILPYRNNGSNWTTNNRCGQNSRIHHSSNCYRPLQQLYKTIYSPMNGNNSSHNKIACICRPSEKYKTTNMTYGSFHYNNWAFMQKNRPVNYNRKHVVQCYDKQQKMNYQSKYNNHLTGACNSNESQYWSPPTSDACCPTDCYNNTTSNLLNY